MLEEEFHKLQMPRVACVCRRSELAACMLAKISIKVVVESQMDAHDRPTQYNSVFACNRTPRIWLKIHTHTHTCTLDGSYF